jgi:NTE family protein
MEAGGMKALYEAGIRPEMIVGSSAGALNATFVATDPSAEGIDRLCDIWRNLRSRDIVPGNLVNRAWRLLRGKPSVFDPKPLQAFVENHLPPGVRTFGDLPPHVQLYVTAASLQTSALYLFGEDKSASLRDAALASSAFPGGFPPVRYGRWQYADGGIIANVPISVAVDKGATTIYVLDVAYTGGVYGPATSVVGILLRVANIVLHQDLLRELQYATQQPGMTVHHLIIRGVPQASDFNFDYGREMVETGYRQVSRYLDRLVSSTPPAEAPVPAPVEVAPAPPGARLWVPPYRRQSP